MNKMMSLFVVFLLVLSPFSLGQIEIEEVSEDVPDCNWWCKTKDFMEPVGKVLFGDSEARALAGTAWFDRSDGLPLATGFSVKSCLDVPISSGGFCTVTKNNEVRVFFKQNGQVMFQGIQYDENGKPTYSESFHWLEGYIADDEWATSTATVELYDYIASAPCESTGTCTIEGMNAWNKWKTVEGVTDPQIAIDYDAAFDGDVNTGKQFVSNMGDLGLSTSGSLKLYEKTGYDPDKVTAWVDYYELSTWINKEDHLLQVYDAFDGNLGHAKTIDKATSKGTISEMKSAYDAAGKDPDLAAAVIEASEGNAALATTHLERAQGLEGKETLNPAEKISSDIVNAAKGKATGKTVSKGVTSPNVLPEELTSGDQGDAKEVADQFNGYNLDQDYLFLIIEGKVIKVTKKSDDVWVDDKGNMITSLGDGYSYSASLEGATKTANEQLEEIKAEAEEKEIIADPLPSQKELTQEEEKEVEEFKKQGTYQDYLNLAKNDLTVAFLLHRKTNGDIDLAQKYITLGGEDPGTGADLADLSSSYADAEKYVGLTGGDAKKAIDLMIYTSTSNEAQQYNNVAGGDVDTMLTFAYATTNVEYAKKYIGLASSPKSAAKLAEFMADEFPEKDQDERFDGAQVLLNQCKSGLCSITETTDGTITGIVVENGEIKEFQTWKKGFPPEEVDKKLYSEVKAPSSGGKVTFNTANVQVPEEAVTGKTLFGSGASCDTCKYWKSKEGKYYKQNEDGTVVELTGTPKNQLIAKGKAVPTLETTFISGAPTQAADAAAAAEVSTAPKSNGWGEVFGTIDSVDLTATEQELVAQAELYGQQQQLETAITQLTGQTTPQSHLGNLPEGTTATIQYDEGKYYVFAQDEDFVTTRYELTDSGSLVPVENIPEGAATIGKYDLTTGFAKSISNPKQQDGAELEEDTQPSKLETIGLRKGSPADKPDDQIDSDAQETLALLRTEDWSTVTDIGDQIDILNALEQQDYLQFAAKRENLVEITVTKGGTERKLLMGAVGDLYNLDGTPLDPVKEGVDAGVEVDISDLEGNGYELVGDREIIFTTIGKKSAVSLGKLKEEILAAKVPAAVDTSIIPESCTGGSCVVREELVGGEPKDVQYFIHKNEVKRFVEGSNQIETLDITLPAGATGFDEENSDYKIGEGTASDVAFIAFDNGDTLVGEATKDEKGLKVDKDKQTVLPTAVIKESGKDKEDSKTSINKEGEMIVKIGDEIYSTISKAKNSKGVPTGMVLLNTPGADGKGTKTGYYYNGNYMLTANEDGKTYTDSSGKNFELADGKDFDEKQGTCAKEGACFKSEDGFYKGLSIYDSKSNWFANQFGAMSEDVSPDGERTESWLYVDKQGNEYEGTVVCSGDSDTKCKLGKAKTDVLEKNGFYVYDTDYGGEEGNEGSDENDVRTYETETVGLFRYVDAGVGYGDCDKSGCDKNIFFTPDNNEIYNCEKGKSREECAQTSKKFSNDAAGYDELCDGEDKCKADVDKRASSRTLHRFFAGDTEWQQTGAQVYDLLDLSGWNSISMALLGDSYATELASEIDQWFAGTVLDERFYSSAICYALESYDVQGTDYAYIETPGGSFQAVASIQAEKTLEKNPMLCVENEEGGFYCPSKLYCNEEDMFCYEDEYAEEPTVGYFYKITWGVSAPFDESLTPYSDEDGAISFNVYIGEKPVYSKSVHLDNGETDGDKINHYSATEYKIEKICIKWFKAPLTASRSSGFDFEPNAIGNVCTKFKKSTKGSVDYDYGSSGESTSVSGGDVKRKQDW